MVWLWMWFCLFVFCVHVYIYIYIFNGQIHNCKMHNLNDDASNRLIEITVRQLQYISRINTGFCAVFFLKNIFLFINKFHIFGNTNHRVSFKCAALILAWMSNVDKNKYANILYFEIDNFVSNDMNMVNE